MQRSRIALPLLVIVVILGAAGTVDAGVDVDFGAEVRLSDRADLYFSISSRYFGCDRETVANWGPRYRDPDDLAVVLFISRRSGRELDELWALRQQRGLSWWEIAVRYGVPLDAWFVDVERDPGPPYGKAYGYRKKHGGDRQADLRLSDADLRNLVAVRMLHEYYGISVESAMEWRAGGRSLQDLMSEEYEKRHGKPYDVPTVASSAEKQPGNGRGRGRSKNPHK